MDFSKADLIPILQSSMPCRFADMPPRDFELLVAQLFQDTGFLIEQVKHGSDYGIDVIAAKDRQRLAIQVKRYAENNKVGVQDVNQAVGGVKFYNCDHVIFITTSDFTQSAQRLAKATGVELWNWSEFQKRLSDVYLGGNSYQEYFGVAVPTGGTTEPVAAELMRAQRTQMKGNYSGALFYIGLSNKTATNIEAQVVGATYITTKNAQYSLRHFLEGYFTAGMIYAGCTVETCVVFDFEQLNRVELGDKIVLDLIADGTRWSFVLLFNETVKMVAPSVQPGCFIATAAFGTEMATEVVTLRDWRDLQLRRTAFGRLTVAMYYFVSPSAASWIRCRPVARMIVRSALRPFVWYAMRSIRWAR